MILEKIEELYIIFCLKIGRVIGVATDKVAHFFCCFMASIILGFMFSIETGVIAAIAMGVGKEYGDSCSPVNRWSWGDIFADFMGAVVGAFVVYGLLVIL